MGEFRVTMDACTAGNPFKAWNDVLPEAEHRVGDRAIEGDLAPDRELPDDVWEHQIHEFDTLDAAKGFVRALPEKVTTHVVLEHLLDDGTTWQPIYVQDAGAEHLDDAAPGVTPPHLVDSPLPFEGLDDYEEAPQVMPSQGAQQ